MLRAAVFPTGFHCTGFNEVDGKAGLMEDRSLHLVIRKFVKSQHEKRGCVGRSFSALSGVEREANVGELRQRALG